MKKSKSIYVFPAELLRLVCYYADAETKLSLQLSSKVFREILLPCVWSNLVFDFRCFGTTRIDQFEGSRHDHGLVNINKDEFPQLRLNDKQLAELCIAIFEGKCIQQLTFVKDLTIILPREVYHSPPPVIRKAKKFKKMHSQQLVTWMVEHVFWPDKLSGLQNLEIIAVETYANSKLSPVVLANRFNCQKQITVDSQQLVNHKYDLSKVDTLRIGLNEKNDHNDRIHTLVPQHITNLGLYRTNPKHFVKRELRPSLAKLTNLKSLSLQGVEFPFENGMWLPENVESLEMSYNSLLEGTFHNVKTLRLNTVTHPPFEKLHFPNLQQLYLDCRAVTTLTTLGDDSITELRELHVSGLPLVQLEQLLQNVYVTDIVIATGLSTMDTYALTPETINRTSKNLVLGFKENWDKTRLKTLLHTITQYRPKAYIIGGPNLNHILEKLQHKNKHDQHLKLEPVNMSFMAPHVLVAPPIPEPLIRGHCSPI